MIHLLYKNASSKTHPLFIPSHVSYLEEGFSSNVLGPHSMAKTQQTNEPQTGLAGTFKIDFKKNLKSAVFVAAHFWGQNLEGGKREKNNLSDWPDRFWGCSCPSIFYMLQLESCVSQN